MSPSIPRLFALILALSSVSLLIGCPRVQHVARPTAPKTTMSVEVVPGTFMVTDDDERVQALLLKEIVQYNVALPISKSSGKQADLRLKVELSGFTTITEAQWSLTNSTSGVVIASGSETYAPFPASPEDISDLILSDLTPMDLGPYAGGQNSTTPPSNFAQTTLKPNPSQTGGASSWAIVVGIEQYRDGLTPALHAESDARTFAKFAKTTLGVPEDHVRLLIGQRATRADLESVFEEWLPRQMAKPGNTVYVYFSGHGAPDPTTGDAFLVPYDADPALIKSRGYALTRLYASLRKLEEQNVYVFLDSCFSGNGARSVLPKGTRPLVPIQDARPQGNVFALSASAPGQITGVSSKQPHGLFTYHLLSGINGAADANNDDNVTLEELFAHVRTKVSKEARLENRDQNPKLHTPKTAKPSNVTVVRGLERD